MRQHCRARCQSCIGGPTCPSVPMPRKPDTPCAVCGTLIWSGATSLPPGQRTCRPCRATGARWSITNSRHPEHTPSATHRVDCPCGQTVMREQPQTYCSLACANSLRPRKVHHCEVCATQYRPTYSGQRTCGRTCGALLQQANRSELPRRWPRTSVRYANCRRCTALFVARSRTIYHCGVCRTTSACNRLKPPTDHTCKWCGDSFTSEWSRANPKGRRRTFCSERCSKQANRSRGRWKCSPAKRRAVYVRDGGRCHLCEQVVEQQLPPGDPWSVTLDHLLPRSAGGTDELENLALAHLWCNSARGVQPVDVARAWLGPQRRAEAS